MEWTDKEEWRRKIKVELEAQKYVKSIPALE